MAEYAKRQEKTRSDMAEILSSDGIKNKYNGPTKKFNRKDGQHAKKKM